MLNAKLCVGLMLVCRFPRHIIETLSGARGQLAPAVGGAVPSIGHLARTHEAVTVLFME